MSEASIAEAPAETRTPDLLTPLDALHRRLGGKMVGFAGYQLPVQYPAGILAEHRHTRDAASLFDVSHMGQVKVRGAEAARWVEALVTADLQALEPGQTRYTLLLNDFGGTIDDLLVSRPSGDRSGETLLLVFNAARKAVDTNYLATRLGPAVTVEPQRGRALLALQGPASAQVMARLAPASGKLGYMRQATMEVAGVECWVGRSGYTGEDGFEISVPSEEAQDLAERLLAEAEVAPAGLGARDTLRLEAGLCLYGHELDETISPAEAGLTWTIGKRRREAADFPGAKRILREMTDGASRRRVGLLVEGRAPLRDGVRLLSRDGGAAGVVSSGGFAPSLERPIAMAYVAPGYAETGTELLGELRGRQVAATVTKLPFLPPRTARG